MKAFRFALSGADGREVREKRSSGAKARVGLISRIRGLKPPPPSGSSFLAAGRASAGVWIKALQAGALAVAVCFSLGATDAGSRYNDLSHRMMCSCGCNQLVGECNHVGCPASPGMLKELRTGIEAGKTDQEILNSIVAEYGAVVLAAPTTHGFDLVAWIAPFAVFGAALLGTVLLVRRWSVGRTQFATGVDAADMDPAERARLETIRRETDAGNDEGV